MPGSTPLETTASAPLTTSPAPSPPRPAASDRLARLRWRLNRLRCMTPAEILQRLGRAITVGWSGLFPARLRATPVADLSRTGQPWLAVPAGIDPGPWQRAAGRLAAGRFDLFARPDNPLGSPPEWNRDPKTGIRAPLVFGKWLDYRDPAKVGDIKYLWELNRHAHLVTLAQSWALTGEAGHAELIRRHLLDWFEHCPPGLGPNWSSALEAGLRLISWSATWQLLGGAASPLFATPAGRAWQTRWLASVWQHCRFIHGFHSLHSSANNHLIGEAAGLFVATVTWPCWPQAAGWQAAARRILEGEIARQVAPDGVDREQSTAYQLFVFQLLLQPWLAARANGQPLSAAYAARLESMLGFLAAVMDSAGHVPMIGDGDDAVVLRLDPDDTPERRYGAALATGAIVFGRADWRARVGRLDAASRWLPGADAAWASLPADTTAAPQRIFREGGYYILGNAFGQPDEIRLVADAGPLGYGGIAAHGHADALSFTLAVGGLEFLVDTGTCAYHADPLWRQYFRGTAAHNTARVDGLDQSTPGGNFMWLHKARAGCRHWHSSPEEDVFEGWHDGYHRLPDPVHHRRRISFDKRARRILIEDRFDMAGSHDIELFFHCDERCQVTHGPDGYRLVRAGRQIILSLPQVAGSTQDACYGSLAPLAGWISRRYDERQPLTTVRWRARLSGPQRLYTRLLC